MTKDLPDGDSASDYIERYAEYIERQNRYWGEIEKLVEKMRLEFNSLLCSKYGKAFERRKR